MILLSNTEIAQCTHSNLTPVDCGVSRCPSLTSGEMYSTVHRLSKNCQCLTKQRLSGSEVSLVQTETNHWCVFRGLVEPTLASVVVEHTETNHVPLSPRTPPARPSIPQPLKNPISPCFCCGDTNHTNHLTTVAIAGLLIYITTTISETWAHSGDYF